MRLLFDTTVLIDVLRGRHEALNFVDQNINDAHLSAITIAELFAGLKEGSQRRQLERMRIAFDIIPIDDQIAETAGNFRRSYGPSHGTGILDAIIAASAEHIGARLVTHNVKHFPMLHDVLMPY